MSNAKIAAHCLADSPRPDVVKFAIATGIAPVGTMANVLAGPPVNAPLTGHEADPLDIEVGGEPRVDPAAVAVAQLVQVNEILDEVAPNDPEDMDIVERVRALLTRPAESAPIDEATLIVPAPAMADMLAQMMCKGFNDMRFHAAPSTRAVGDDKWECAWSEGLFIGNVTRNWQQVSRANAELVTINQRIGDAYRAAQAAEGAEKNARRKIEAATGKPPTIRVVSHKEVKVGKGKAQKTVMEPVTVEVVDRKARPQIVEKLQTQFEQAHAAKSEADRELAELNKTRRWAKETIENSVPEPFAFSLADLASGKVRIGDSW